MASNIHITERDYKILRFIWKWKTVSTLAIARKFFPNILPLSAYRRLMHLEVSGYLKSTPVEKKWQETWELTNKSFKYILPKLGELEHKGYKSENIYHDHLASAVHLGEWLTHQPDNSQTYSEQQLRRYPANAWPYWVPKSETHRPDGYSAYTANGKSVILAFETELSVKASHRYEAVVAYYDSQESISCVFWLVDSKVTLNALTKAFEKFQLRRRDLHQFVFLSDFKIRAWKAPIVHGRYKGKTLSNLIPQINLRMASDTSPGADVLALLDCRKYPAHSNTSAKSLISKKSD